MGKYLFQMFIFSTIILQTMALPGAPTCSRRIRVYIVNMLPLKTSPLLVHCKSKDEDNGNQSLPYRGQGSSFSFCPSFTTRFVCNFRWNDKDTSFDVFNSVKTNVCYYEARSDAIYFSEDDATPRNFIKLRDW
ncbi:hypothetical protein CASFOL_012984 [Castilleja foliolosa]|uniref:S-protein homolog n=1 Tax=Castilleja foliolosa TaxID=1961234 RepID=A0ABD3DM83_9LAMI